jgi:hypothetical protein
MSNDEATPELIAGTQPVGQRLDERIAHLLLRRRAREVSESRKRLWLAVAAALFIGAFALGLTTLPEIHRPVRWLLFVLSGLFGAPALVALGAAEYDASARMLGHDPVPVRESLRVSILSTAANLLPIPGSAIVRTAALYRLGSPIGGAVLSTLTVGLSWVATGALIIGVSLLADSPDVFGFVLLVGGVLSLSGIYVVMRRIRGPTGVNSLFARIVVIESLFVVVGAVRFLLVVAGLGFSPSLSQAAALTLSGMVASMTGIFPAGLGIRELAAGAISPLINLPASVGIVAASIIRIANLAVLAPISMLFLYGRDRRIPNQIKAGSEVGGPLAGSEAREP